MPAQATSGAYPRARVPGLRVTPATGPTRQLAVQDGALANDWDARSAVTESRQLHGGWEAFGRDHGGWEKKNPADMGWPAVTSLT